MSAAGALIFPLARAYAEHAGLSRDGAALRVELEARLDAAGPLSRALYTGAALLLRGAAPLVFLGRPSGFGALSPREKEALLSRLQCSPNVLARGAFLGLKCLLTGLCYGPPAAAGDFDG